MNPINTLLYKLPDFVYVLFPLVTGFATAFFCPMKNINKTRLKFQPPSYVFGIVWPILYLMLGFAWVNSKSHSLWYLILSLLLCAWIFVYSCQKNKYLALAIILFCIMFVLFCYTLSNKISQVLLIPLFVWLSFATLLSVFTIYEM